MIQCTPEIVNSVADEKTYFFRDGGDLRDKNRRVVNLRDRVFLGRDCVRMGFSEPRNSKVQLMNVVFGPFNLEPNTG
jgi:hypothetical protein